MYIHSKVNRTNFLFSFFFVFQFFLLVVDRTKYKKSLITSRVSPLEPLYGCLRRWNRSRDDRHWWRNDLRDFSDDHVSMHFNQIWKLVLDNDNKGKETCQNLFCMLRSFLFFFFFAYFLDDLIEKAYSVFHLRLNINMYVYVRNRRPQVLIHRLSSSPKTNVLKGFLDFFSSNWNIACHVKETLRFSTLRAPRS